MAEARQIFQMLTMYFFSGWGLITIVDLVSDVLNSTQRSPIELSLGILGSIGMIVYWIMMILHKRKINKSDVKLKETVQKLEEQRLQNAELERNEIMNRDAGEDWTKIVSEHKAKEIVKNNKEK